MRASFPVFALAKVLRPIVPPAVLVGIAGLGALAMGCRPTDVSGGWGIDACLSCHVSKADVPEYLQLLQTSDVRWVRERDLGGDGRAGLTVEGFPGSADPTYHRPANFPSPLVASRLQVWERERRAGFRVVAFASPREPLAPSDSANQLPEDLLRVYWAYRESARLAAGRVDAWEMVGEADASYCSDLPDRVAAFQKAVYLALKDGAREARRTLEPMSRRGIPVPAVLMGALAYPPGPWLTAAAENGLFAYTDAINIHHYGFARDLGGVIDAHRQVAQRWSNGRVLPVWITETGLNNVPRDDWRNPVARRDQAQYLIDSAQQAIAHEVAVFMPFVLVWRDSPFAMTERASETYPTWERYRDFTRGHALEPDGPLVVPPLGPSRLVLQWLPDTLTCTPSKISRCYWFDDEDEEFRPTMEGEIRVYNLDSVPVRFRLTGGPPVGSGLSVEWTGTQPEEAELIPPWESRVYRMRITSKRPGFNRNMLRYEAQSLDEKGQGSAGSALAFSVGSVPMEQWPHREYPLAFGPALANFASITDSAPFADTSRSISGRGINGVTVTEGNSPGEFSFDVFEQNPNALAPPMAIFSLPTGLPVGRNAFLRLRALDGTGRPAFIRVDLVDVAGQRFSIVEGLGRNSFNGGSDTVLLGYEDFHRWVFGRCRAGIDFRPQDIRELQLRFTGAETRKTFRVHLDALDFIEGS